MSGFSAEWLALREPVDHRARYRPLLALVAGCCDISPSPTILDLASGTGSTVRALSPHLGPDQRWRLADHDAALLERTAALADDPNIRSIEPFKADLNVIPAAALEGADLVTTSAFLDLVSARWLDAMVKAIAGHRLAFYAALSYDGRIACEPDHPLDGLVATAVNLHQRGDKGFGPALGAEAAGYAIDLFEKAGYTVARGPSDWRALPQEQAFQSELVRGWAQAAAETGLVSRKDLQDWRAARLASIDLGVSRLTVGHIDFVALPGDAATT